MLQYVILISTGITSVNNNDNINGVRLRLKIALDVWKHLRVWEYIFHDDANQVWSRNRMADETPDRSLRLATTNIKVLLKERLSQRNLNHRHRTDKDLQ